MNDSSIWLDHVAIAVENLESVKKIYQDLGLNFPQPSMTVENQQVNVLMSPVKGPTNLEFLEPTDSKGSIGKYLEKKGPGIHHLCFRVSDIHELMDRLIKLGYIFVYPSPQTGAHSSLVNFLHPKSTQGILIEFSQHNK